MRYHDITHDDMLNGEGLRVVLWVSGCEHRCPGCQNPITWNPEDGLVFGEQALQELYNELDKSYISGVTISGGDPLFPGNRESIGELVKKIKTKYPHKSLWLYTGYLWEHLVEDVSIKETILSYADVLVDGPFVEAKKDLKMHWAGSTNQRVIDVQASLQNDGEIMLFEADSIADTDTYKVQKRACCN